MNPELKAALEALGISIDDFRAHYGKRLDELELILARGLPQGTPARPGTSLLASPVLDAFGSFVLTGDTAPIRNSASISVDPTGGFLVPQVSEEIARLAPTLTPMRQLATVRGPVAGSPYSQLVTIGAAGTGWAGETQARPATGTPPLARVDIHAREVYANLPVSQALLDLTAPGDAARWLIGSIVEAFADRENAAFLAGPGALQPRGILTYDTSLLADATRPWGQIQHTATGDAGGFAAATASVSPLDALVTVRQSLKAAYRRNARWLMNADTLGLVRTFKDPTGRHVVADPLTEGAPSLLLGHPVAEDPNMPDVGAGTFPIAFADFQRAYLVVDFAPGTSVLRDPFTDKPNVRFYATRRVGGEVVNFEAIKLIRVAA